jgi:hypothetical protein
MLLPRQGGITGQTVIQKTADLKLPAWLPLVVFCVMMGLLVMAGTFAATPPAQAPIAQSVEAGQ